MSVLISRFTSVLTSSHTSSLAKGLAAYGIAHAKAAEQADMAGAYLTRGHYSERAFRALRALETRYGA